VDVTSAVPASIREFVNKFFVGVDAIDFSILVPGRFTKGGPFSETHLLMLAHMCGVAEKEEFCYLALAAQKAGGVSTVDKCQNFFGACLSFWCAA
jgi:hypothetical protein